jgi:hypothetical protein
MISSGIETTTFRIVAQCLNTLRYRVSQHPETLIVPQMFKKFLFAMRFEATITIGCYMTPYSLVDRYKRSLRFSLLLLVRSQFLFHARLNVRPRRWRQHISPKR